MSYLVLEYYGFMYLTKKLNNIPNLEKTCLLKNNSSKEKKKRALYKLIFFYENEVNYGKKCVIMHNCFGKKIGLPNQLIQ